MKKSRFSESQIIAILKQADGGTPAPENGAPGRIGYVVTMAPNTSAPH